MTNRSAILLCIVLLALLGAAYIQGLFSLTEKISKEKSAVDIHTEALNDGHTIMAMAHTMNPKILYVKPSELLRFINHELDPMMLILDDGSTLTKEATVGGEVKFTAPASLGTYLYVSSTNKNMTGTIVIEQ